jgi:hypothetical protein
MRWLNPLSWLTRSRSRSVRQFGRTTRRVRLRVEDLEDRFLLTTVTNLNNAGSGSLRDAIFFAPNGGTVDFASNLSGTITLTTGNLPIGKNLTINGPGASKISIDGHAISQVFNIASNVSVSIAGLTISGGVSGVVNGVTNNLGGGIFNIGNLTITNCVITSNIALSTLGGQGLGGGIFNGGNLTVRQSLIFNNLAQASGIAGGQGGGIYNRGSMTLENDTIVNNSAGQGAGIANITVPPTTATANITNCTIANNSSGSTGQGGGILAGFLATTNLRNTLIAGNSGGNAPDISGNISSAVNNLVGNGSGSTGVNNGDNGNQVGTGGSPIDPKLGSLRDNGGPTMTVALLAGSPAIDAGSNSNAPGTDQRGFNRPVNGTIDIGAYEFQQPATNTTLTISPNPGTTGQPVRFQVSVVGTAANSNGVAGTVTIFDGNTALGTVSLSSGNGALSQIGFTAGNHAITAHYNGFSEGDYGFNPSTTNVINLTITPLSYFAVGGAPNTVDLYNDRDGSFVARFTPFIGYTGGVDVALGDILGNGFKDLIVAPNSGNPQVKIYDGRAIVQGTFNPNNPDASLVTTFFAYGISFNIGATLAVADVSGDGFPDLITGATAGNPQVKVYNGKAFANGTFNAANPDASLLTSFFAYGLNFNIGVNVGGGDVNHDGFADLITGPTAGNPHVKVYDGKAIANGTFNPATPDTSLLTQFFAFGLNFNVGASITVGDVNGAGFGDVIVGATSGNPQVKVYDGMAIANATFDPANPDASLLATFYAYDLGLNIGVNLSAGDLEGTGRADILTGPTTGAPRFRVVRGLSSGVLPPAVNGIDGIASSIIGGITVGV